MSSYVCNVDSFYMFVFVYEFFYLVWPILQFLLAVGSLFCGASRIERPQVKRKKRGAKNCEPWFTARGLWLFFSGCFAGAGEKAKRKHHRKIIKLKEWFATRLIKKENVLAVIQKMWADCCALCRMEFTFRRWHWSEFKDAISKRVPSQFFYAWIFFSRMAPQRSSWKESVLYEWVTSCICEWLSTTVFDWKVSIKNWFQVFRIKAHISPAKYWKLFLGLKGT